MNVLSLFDGMSCGQIALNRANIKYDKYFACEIDKYAIKVTLANYPNTIQLGDVSNLKGCDLPKIDLLIGGSPCQSFSNAGNREGFDGKSKLFWEFVRILKECKPKYFLFENVVMKKEWKQVITESLGVEPIAINSRLVCGANRPRLYWTNIPNIEQPKNTNTKLIDVLENLNFNKEPRIENYSSNKAINYKAEKFHTLTTGGSGKGICDDAGWWRKLTPVECERLQTVPDNYTSCVSDTQRYRMLGNGWTVDVITHILKSLLEVK